MLKRSFTVDISRWGKEATIRNKILLTGSLLLLGTVVWAQRNGPNGPSAAGGCALCGSLIFIPIAIFVLNIALLVWVARDAKPRGMDSAVIWMIPVMFTSVIGLMIYIFSRPQGNLIQCPHCNNKRLQASALDSYQSPPNQRTAKGQSDEVSFTAPAYPGGLLPWPNPRENSIGGICNAH